jgi:hypothetical protein
MGNYEYISPKQITTCGRYPFSLAQVRHFLLFRHRNGLASAIRKVGKRILLRADLWEAWLEGQISKKENINENYTRDASGLSRGSN